MGEDQVSESLHEPTDLETDVYGRLRALLRAAWKRRVSLRLVSLKLSNVYDGRFRSELPLEVAAQQHEARARLAGVIDELRRSRGASVILRGHDFRLRDAVRPGLPIANCQLPIEPEATRQPPIGNPQSAIRNSAVTYVPLRAHSHNSFLDSTLSPTRVAQPWARSCGWRNSTTCPQWR